MSTPKSALVTGAASGLGRLAARRLAVAGYRVAALDVDAVGLAETAYRAPTMRTWSCDVADPAAVADTVRQVVEQVGAPVRVVHAAGLFQAAPALEHPLADVERVFAVNFLGTVYVVRATLPAMIEHGAGEMVLFGSLAGWLPAPHLSAYAAAKSAVIAYAEVLNMECAGSGVRICCVCPGDVDSPVGHRVRRTDEDPAALPPAPLPPTAPSLVLDAADQALRAGTLYAFPGFEASAVWRARRLAHGVDRIH